MITEPQRRHFRLKSPRVPSLLLVVALAAAACGSSDGTPTTDAGAETTASTEAALTNAGVPTLADESDEDADSSESDSESDADADGGAPEEGDPEEGDTDTDGDATQEAAVQEFIACMTEEGVDAGALNATTDPAEIEAITSDPIFIAAEEVCSPILEDAFGDISLDPAMEAAIAERSAEMAACAREFLDIEIPDDILLLDEDDPRAIAVFDYETTPEEEAKIDACFDEILGDVIDDDGNLIAPEEGE